MSNYFERSKFSIVLSMLNKSTSQNYSHTKCICENDKFQIISTASAKLFFWTAWKPLEAILQNRAWGDPGKTHWKDQFRMSYCVHNFSEHSQNLNKHTVFSHKNCWQWSWKSHWKDKLSIISIVCAQHFSEHLESIYKQTVFSHKICQQWSWKILLKIWNSNSFDDVCGANFLSTLKPTQTDVLLTQNMLAVILGNYGFECARRAICPRNVKIYTAGTLLPQKICFRWSYLWALEWISQLARWTPLRRSLKTWKKHSQSPLQTNRTVKKHEYGSCTKNDAPLCHE